MKGIVIPSYLFFLPFFACVQEGTEVQKFNLAPSVSIQSPAEGSYFDERTEIVFEALISDNADDLEMLDISWVLIYKVNRRCRCFG